ncbi:MAG: hypothetical protein AAGA60_22415 [Cyanobacteria bacterium P01_E01_bin.42]
MSIKFNTYLKDEDWMPAMRGWRCEALLIPNVKFEALYYDGNKDDTNFRVENHIIRWLGDSKPKDILVILSLTEDSSQLEQERLRLEQEKLNLEQKKASIETKWKIITAIGAILSGLLTFGTTYFVRKQESITLADPPKIQTFIKAMSVSENQCIESLEKSLGNYGLRNINPVRGGIYATRRNYNIFIACNTDLNAILLVVSGSDNSEARQIREDIKRLLP